MSYRTDPSYFACFTQFDLTAINDGNSGWSNASSCRLEDIEWDNPEIKKLLETLRKESEAK